MEYIRTPKVENVRLVDIHSRNAVSGTLYLTATHLIFVDLARKKETWLLHSHIQSLEKSSITQDGSPLRIRCKTFQVLTFLISQERDCHDLYSSLMKLSKPVKMEELYAFSYNPREAQLTQKEGWDLFSLNNDYLQMGLNTKYWRVSRMNDDFSLCDTYPKLLCVPSLASPALMFGSAAFRSRRRLPVMSYLHTNGSVIVRCSQPMAGLKSRSVEDEAFVDLIRRSKSDNNDFMYIVDTRPMINAVANRAQGKGYENTDLYENIKYRFIGIDNIHVMRNSLNKMLEACEDSSSSMGAWLEAINSSGWLKHVHSVIQVSRFIANAVGVENRSVLVHCSDGWDRTAQTCALASIMLNPHYRTIDGLLALIQKEWLNFGHKFEHRCGHLDTDIKETSPVFTQFLDAVWQLMRLKPCSFQFNQQLLFDLHDHAYSCQFGTFLGNCPKVRQDINLETRTHSLWGWMIKRMDVYTNPLYRAAEQHRSENQLFLPPTTPHFVRLWTGMYNRFDGGLQPRENVASAVKALHGEAMQLAKGVRDMKKLRDQYLEALGMTVPDDTEIPNESSETENSTKRFTPRIEKSSFPVTPRRPASTDDVTSLIAVKKQPVLGLATHSSPNIARNNKKMASLSLNEDKASPSVTVSFSANCLSDDEQSTDHDSALEDGLSLVHNVSSNQTDITNQSQRDDQPPSKSASTDSWVSLHKDDFAKGRPIAEVTEETPPSN